MNRPSLTGSGRAFTLTEVVMTVLIGSLLVVALTRIFSGGMLQSQRGSSHLTNLQAAAIVLAQIEKDLSLARELPILGGGSGGGPAGAGAIQCDIVADYGLHGELANAHVSYQPGPGGRGFQRTETAPDGPQTHVFGEGLKIEVTCEQVQVNPGKGIGFVVEVTASKPPDGTEKNTLRRFIYGYNLALNRTRTTHDWKW
jgi:hypothetical protein